MKQKIKFFLNNKKNKANNINNGKNEVDNDKNIDEGNNKEKEESEDNDSDNKDNEGEEELKEEKIEKNKKVREKNNKKEQEFLRHQANTSFGKMVLGSLKTNPSYSIGKAQRAPMYEIIKTPGPIYKHENLSNLKYRIEDYRFFQFQRFSLIISHICP